VTDVGEVAWAGVIKLVPLGTHDMVVDALTKSLPAPALVCHREIMMGHHKFTPFWFARLLVAHSLW
jgi:hypothetical protein